MLRQLLRARKRPALALTHHFFPKIPLTAWKRNGGPGAALSRGRREEQAPLRGKRRRARPGVGPA